MYVIGSVIPRIFSKSYVGTWTEHRLFWIVRYIWEDQCFLPVEDDKQYLLFFLAPKTALHAMKICSVGEFLVPNSEDYAVI